MYPTCVSSKLCEFIASQNMQWMLQVHKLQDVRAEESQECTYLWRLAAWWLINWIWKESNKKQKYKWTMWLWTCQQWAKQGWGGSIYVSTEGQTAAGNSNSNSEIDKCQFLVKWGNTPLSVQTKVQGICRRNNGGDKRTSFGKAWSDWAERHPEDDVRLWRQQEAESRDSKSSWDCCALADHRSCHTGDPCLALGFQKLIYMIFAYFFTESLTCSGC